MNFQDFRAHSGPFPIAGVNIAGVNIAGVNIASVNIASLNIVRQNNEMYHTTSFGRSPDRVLVLS